MRNSAFVYLFLLFIGTNVFAQEHLESTRHIKRMIKILFDRKLITKPELIFLIEPPFPPSKVIFIKQERSKYFLLFYKLHPGDSYIKKRKREIEQKSAQVIIDLIKNSINKSREIDSNVVHRDGADYYFFAKGTKIKGGKIWSPDENSKMDKLVKISEKLIVMISNSEKKTIKFDEKYLKEIKELEVLLNQQ